MWQRQLKMHLLLLELLPLSSGSSGAAQMVWELAAVAACHPQARLGMHQQQKQACVMMLRAVRVRRQAGRCAAPGVTGAT
jgi:hypothetical protein